MQETATQRVSDAVTPEAGRTERVCLETATHSITGNVSLPLHGHRTRFSDYLNRSEVDYLALSDVDRVALGGGPVTQFSFLAVARESVLFGYPLKDRDADLD